MRQATDLEFESALGELSRCRASLRNRLIRAMGVAAQVVLEQRPPFCQAFLHVHRLLLQLSHEVQAYFDMEEASLPEGQEPGGPYSTAGWDRLAAMLRSGQGALSALLADMYEAADGFHAAPEAGASYRVFIDLLEAIHAELILQFRLEEQEVFPRLSAGLPATPAGQFPIPLDCPSIASRG